MTQAIEMPSFEFGQLSVESDEALEAELNANGKKYVEKTFKPGEYDLVIDNIEAKRSDKDDTWTNVCLTLKGTGEKSIKAYVLVPSQDIKYGAQKTLLPFKGLQNFAGALGHDLKVSTLKPVIKALFARPEKLVGKTVKARIGYQKGYPQYAGKNGEGANVFNLVDRKNEIVRNADGQPLEFADKAAVEMYAKENNIPYDQYTRVLSYAQGNAAAAEQDDFF